MEGFDHGHQLMRIGGCLESNRRFFGSDAPIVDPWEKHTVAEKSLLCKPLGKPRACLTRFTALLHINKASYRPLLRGPANLQQRPYSTLLDIHAWQTRFFDGGSDNLAMLPADHIGKPSCSHGGSFRVVDDKMLIFSTRAGSAIDKIWLLVALDARHWLV